MPNLKLEQIHIGQFIKLFFNTDVKFEQQQPPEPDFKIISNEKNIGIEHTRLIRMRDANGIDVMAHSKIANKIMSEAETLYNVNQSMCLMVHVSFRCDYGLMSSNHTQLYNNDIKELSQFIADFVTLQLTMLEATEPYAHFTYETYDWNTYQRLLPEKINRITITNTKNFKNSCWAANQGGIIPGIFKSIEFTTLLKKKNKKPQNYKDGYNEIWLLIVEDSMDLTSYFDFENQEIPDVESVFNRIFILRRADNLYHELNVKRN